MTDTELLDWLQARMLREPQGDVLICPPNNHAGPPGWMLVPDHDRECEPYYIGRDLRDAIRAAVRAESPLEPRHVCGLQGFDPWLGDQCPACRARGM